MSHQDPQKLYIIRAIHTTGPNYASEAGWVNIQEQRDHIVLHIRRLPDASPVQYHALEEINAALHQEYQGQFRFEAIPVEQKSRQFGDVPAMTIVDAPNDAFHGYGVGASRNPNGMMRAGGGGAAGYSSAVTQAVGQMSVGNEVFPGGAGTYRPSVADVPLTEMAVTPQTAMLMGIPSDNAVRDIPDTEMSQDPELEDDIFVGFTGDGERVVPKRIAVIITRMCQNATYHTRLEMLLQSLEHHLPYIDVAALAKDQLQRTDFKPPTPTAL